MPKRSNDFQRLVKVIHDALATVDGTRVTESALLEEPDGTRREIDILVERRLADVVIRLAVECRDRARKSDVEWIDGLIGKFNGLQVDKIIAVSRKGFSASAEAKAKASNIELRVLQQCLDHNWSSEFLKLGVASFSFDLTIDRVSATFAPKLSVAETDSLAVELTDGQPVGALSRAFQICFAEYVVPRITGHIESEVLSKGVPLASLAQAWDFVVPVELPNVWVRATNGARHQMTALRYEVKGRGHVEKAPVEHFAYGESALASTAVLGLGPTSHELKIVQVKGGDRLTVNIGRKPAR